MLPSFLQMRRLLLAMLSLLPVLALGQSITINDSQTYLTLQIRVRQRDAGTNLIPEAASTAAGLALQEAATHAHQVGAPVPDGKFKVLTYYYDVPIDDSPTGLGVMRLRATF